MNYEIIYLENDTYGLKDNETEKIYYSDLKKIRVIEELQKQNIELKEDIKNLIKIISKNCDELEATEEEFESLYRWENE